MTESESHRILVVDDEPDITALVAYHLAKAGYRVITAANGRDALRTARQERPDLVVLDLMLPGASGYDVLAELRRREETKDLGVILLTARKEEPDRIKGLSLGADDYLPKPFSPQELVLRVGAVLRRLAAPAVAAGGIVTAGRIALDRRAHRVAADGVLRGHLEDEIARDLEREARLVADLLPADSLRWPEFARELGARVGQRVTLIDAKGTVRGDTEFDRASLDRLENHLLRPEVQQALSTSVGRAERLSASTNERRMYIAVRGGPGGPAGVRVSPTLAAVDAQVDAVQRTVALTELFHEKPARDLVATVLAGLEAEPHELERGGRTLLVTGRALPNGGGLLVIRDVTELRRLEAVRRDFVANVSHELKTPLTSIAGYAETLATEASPGTQTERFARPILSNARRMHRLVDDLLDLSRIESGRWQPDPERVDVRGLAGEAWTAFADRARERRIQFTAAAGDVHHVTADPEALRQVLTNLLDNALRHTPAGGRITVSLESTPGGVIVSVADTGSGIAPEHLPRIFERFYRADPGRSREEGGTGLGLAIVKHLVEAHGGP